MQKQTKQGLGFKKRLGFMGVEQVEELFYCDPKYPPSATSPQPLHGRCETLDETGEEWECPQCCLLEKRDEGREMRAGVQSVHASCEPVAKTVGA